MFYRGNIKIYSGLPHFQTKQNVTKNVVYYIMEDMCPKHTYNFDMERYEVVLALAEAVGDTYSALRT
jgi:NAD-dependent dihydropyrimidine dehydrogenase PreA subunit